MIATKTPMTIVTAIVAVTAVTKIEIKVRIKKWLVGIVVRTTTVVIIVRRIGWRIIIPIRGGITTVWVAVGVGHATAANQQ